MARLLLISHDVVGPVMAGPGIRYYHLARVLAQYLDTSLAIPDHSPGSLSEDTFPIHRYRPDDWPSLARLIPPDTICLLPSDIAGQFPQIREIAGYCVIDGYDPLLAEWLALGTHQAADGRHADWRARMASLNYQYQIGDFFLCASERQRDWWLGLLEANGRINPATYAADPSLRNLIDVVAYGLLSPAPPVQRKAIVKGVWPGIHLEDKLLLWGGGLWPWLDPVTAIRALAQLGAGYPHVKLIFPGTRHPNPKMASMPDHRSAAIHTAQDLGLLDVAVFFGDWVPYAQWSDLLLECDMALTLHFDSLETRLAYRSRVLEYIWAGLPVVAGSGDATAELIDDYGLGRVVPNEDANAVAQAIRDLLDKPDDTRQAAFAHAREAMTWERVAQPLIDYCLAPYRAADRQGGEENIFFPSFEVQLQRERQHWESLVQAYESGRIMRLMRWLQSWRAR